MIMKVKWDRADSLNLVLFYVYVLCTTTLVNSETKNYRVKLGCFIQAALPQYSNFFQNKINGRM